MTENDLFRILLNNGFMALFVVWVLFKGEPRYRETIERQAEENRKAMEVVCKTFEVALTNMHKECRDERRQDLEKLVRVVQDEMVLNRNNRHEANNVLQAALARLYEMGQDRDGSEPKPGQPGSKEHRKYRDRKNDRSEDKPE